MSLIFKAYRDLLFRSNLIFLAMLIMATLAASQCQHQSHPTRTEVETRVEAL